MVTFKLWLPVSNRSYLLLLLSMFSILNYDDFTVLGSKQSDIPAVVAITSTSTPSTTLSDLPANVMQLILQPLTNPDDIMAMTTASKSLANAVVYASGFSLFAQNILSLDEQRPNSSFTAFRRCAHLSREEFLVMHKYSHVPISPGQQLHAEFCFVQLLSLIKRGPINRFNPITPELLRMAAFYIASLGQNSYHALFDDQEDERLSSTLEIALYYTHSFHALANHLSLEKRVHDHCVAEILDQKPALYSTKAVMLALGHFSDLCISMDKYPFCSSEASSSRPTAGIRAELTRRASEHGEICQTLQLVNSEAITFISDALSGRSGINSAQFETSLQAYVKRGFYIQEADNIVRDRIRQSNLPMLQVMLQNGYNPEPRESAAPLLCLAAIEGQVELFKLLLKHGANPNTECKYWIDPLTAIVVRSGDDGIDLLRLLLDYGGRVERAGPHHILHQVALAGNPLMAEYVLHEILNRRIAPPPLRCNNSQRQTFMHVVIGNDEFYPALISYALSLGMDDSLGSLNDVDSQMKTPLAVMLEGRLYSPSLFSLLNVLLKRHDLLLNGAIVPLLDDRIIKSKSSPFLRRMKSSLKSIFSSGQSQPSNNVQSFFLTACKLGMEEVRAAHVALILVQHGADVSESDVQGRACLSWLPPTLTDIHERLVCEILGHGYRHVLPWPIVFKLLARIYEGFAHAVLDPRQYYALDLWRYILNFFIDGSDSRDYRMVMWRTVLDRLSSVDEPAFRRLWKRQL